MKPTCYHLRRVSDGVKIVGGSMPRSITTLDEAAEWLIVQSQVVVSQSGQVHFSYGGGTPVYAYLSIDAAETEQGKEALRQWRIEKRNREDAEAEHNADLERELEDLVGSIGIEAAIRKLQGD